MTAPSLAFAPARRSPAVQLTLPIHNAWVARTGVRYFSSALNDWVPFEGGTDIRVRYSQFPTGYDFSGYPSTLLGPFTMVETSDPGWYYFAINADDITNAFRSLVGQTVYQIIEGVYGASYYALTTSEPLKVIDPRTPLQ